MDVDLIDIELNPITNSGEERPWESRISSSLTGWAQSAPRDLDDNRLLHPNAATRQGEFHLDAAVVQVSKPVRNSRH